LRFIFTASRLAILPQSLKFREFSFTAHESRALPPTAIRLQGFLHAILVHTLARASPRIFMVMVLVWV
jgi:hypothetical protein